MFKPIRTALITLAAVLPLAAQAWWNADWPVRTRIALATTATGVETKEPVANLPLAVRLHSGNFDFLAAKPDGSDLRVLAGDDKTPLPFRIERFDPTNELAVLWVLMPTVAPASEQNVVHVYAGNAAANVEASPATGLDGAVLAALHFSTPDGADASGTLKPAQPPVLEPNGLLAGALRTTGTAVTWPASERVRAAAGGAYTVSLWFRAEPNVAGVLFAQGPLALALEGGKLVGRVSNRSLTGPDVAPAVWRHAALTVGGNEAVLLLDGAVVARAEAATPAIEGPLQLGERFTGLIDELQVAGTVRTPAWLALTAATQGIGAKGITATQEREGEAAAGEGGQHGYMGILVANLTIDAWVVIVILGVMFVIAVWVMISKGVFVTRADGDNQRFLERFRQADDLLNLAGSDAAHARSPLFRLYLAGLRELSKRRVGEPGSAPLSGASLDAVKAAVDADMVRESHRLNAQMVWLTIAISGGPFLGLLGTVVGVMITFAAIAAAGDVNVNAIAPGIAAALLATVAGLAVAIPALFGYNWLASRIKNVSADMQIFVDEFVTRVAERYGAR
jgi:biopolymer transport protein ExbB